MSIVDYGVGTMEALRLHATAAGGAASTLKTWE